MKEFLHNYGIEFFALVPLSSCKVIKPYLLEKNNLDNSCNVITMLIPYRSKSTPTNISVYASVKDYHLFVAELSKSLEGYMKEKFPLCKFKVFSDHSPIDEVHATCISGLGFIGDNGLLINEKYSSFVFLAEAITDLTPEDLKIDCSVQEKIRECLHCGKCASSCPSGCIKRADEESLLPKSFCLSAITQKKGELTKEDISLMIENNTVWGCDICQNVCPFTVNASYTPIEFFKRDIITSLDRATLEGLSEDEFKSRPFAWRGRAVIERNIKLFEEHK